MSDEFDLQSELDRKSGEALMWLNNEHKRGAITDAEYALGLTMFDMTTLGLIDRDVSEWVTNERIVANAQKGSGLRDKVVMIKGMRTLIITLFRSKSAIRVVTNAIGEEDRNYVCDTPQDAVDSFNKLIALMKTRGYEVLK